MSKLSYSVTFLLWFAAAVANGQTPFFQEYHPLKKNQPVQVNALLQDHHGFIWLGSDRGLFRFDGHAFRQFTVHDSLANDVVTALAQDSTGRIWIGHGNGMISTMQNGVIAPYETREGSAVEPISDIIFDRNGVMWFSTKNDGLYYYMNERLYRVDEAEGLPDLFVYDLFEDGRGNVWAATDAGIAICSLTGSKIQIDVVNSDDGLPDIIIKKIGRIDKHIVGLATEDAGLVSFNLSTRQIEPLIPGDWRFGTINDFVVKEDQIWLAAPRYGLLVYDRGMEKVNVFASYQQRSLLSIHTLLKDREGNIWSGLKGGIVRTMGDAIEHIETAHTGDNNVLALAVDGKDRIWYATNDGLFVRGYDAKGAATTVPKLQQTKFKDAPVISLYVDPDGYVWAGLYGDGLLRIHPDRNEVKHFQNELRNGNVLSITGKGNDVWVATLGGSSWIRKENSSFVVTNYGSADGLSSDFIYQVFIDSQDRKWFATDGKGVSMLDAKGFHRFQDGLSSQVVYSIAEDANGNIWASSLDNGLFLFQHDRFVTVPDVRLRDNAVQALIGDKHGNLIAFHKFGIDVYDVNRKQMRYWGEESGIRDKEPNLNAIAADRFGRMFVGMTKGVLKFSLNNDHVIALPEPAIDDIRIFGQSIPLAGRMKLRYDENNVTIHYLGFWYHNTQNVNFQYKLDNYDLEWISTRNQEVTYSRLPAGEYTFRLKASDTDDFTHAREVSVSFSVNPPFWRTPPFYLLIIALLFIGGYGLVKYRERALLEDKLILEAKVEERTREIQSKTEEIQAQNEEIMAQAEEIQGINENLEMLVKQRTAELEKKNQALEEYAFINAHKLRSPVASILGLVNLLAKADQKDDTRVIREHLQESADKLDAIVRSITKAIEKADNKFL